MNYNPRPKINWKASKDRLKDFVRKYNEKPGRSRKEKIKNSHLLSLLHIYEDFFRKFEQGKTRNYSFCLTLSFISIKSEDTQTIRTSYNHIEKFRQKGIRLIKDKTRAVSDFGKGLINCLQLVLDPSFVIFWDDNLNKALSIQAQKVEKYVDSDSKDRNGLNSGNSKKSRFG